MTWRDAFRETLPSRVDPRSAAGDLQSFSTGSRFHSRDLHMVLGRGRRNARSLQGKAERRRTWRPSWIGFRRRWHRRDSTAAYVSARPAEGPVKDVTFEIELLDPGVEAVSFTFG